MSKIIVIDGGNIMHKSIFAFRSNPAMPTTYTYMRMIIGYLKKLKMTPDDMIIIAQDYGKSWRKDIDRKYKAQRKDKRESIESKEWWTIRYNEFNTFFDRIENLLPWHFIKLYRIEADDIASVVCRYYSPEEVILISSDKDWEMLMVFENVKIFSSISKKFKKVPNPMKVLLDKIQGDVSDNLLDKPSSELEFERRKEIVNLLELPFEIEQPIKEQLSNLSSKNLHIEKMPYHSVRQELKKLYYKESVDE